MADLAAARAQAKAALVPYVQAQLRSRLAAVRDALQAVVPALDALDGAVRALEARGVAVAPIVPAISSAAAIRAVLVPYATAIASGLADPSPPRLPRDHVLVKIMRRVSIRLDGDLARGEDGKVLLGDLRAGLHDVRGGAFNYPGERIAVPEATARILVQEGLAERVDDSALVSAR